MNMVPIKTMAKNAGKAISKHSPTILAIVGVVGTATTVVLAVKATPKALMEYEDARTESKLDGKEFRVIDGVKACWKNYIPTAGAFILTSASIIGGNVISVKRIAGLKAALDISETALIAYKDQVVEAIGEKKADDIQNKMEQKNLEKDPPSKKNTPKPVVCDGDAGRHLIRDCVTHEYFWGNMDKVETAIAKANDIMHEEKYQNQEGIGYISYRDVIELMGRDGDCVAGELLGFNTKVHGDIELNRNRSAVCPEDSLYPGEVCYLLMYRIDPIANYDSDILPFR